MPQKQMEDEIRASYAIVARKALSLLHLFGRSNEWLGCYKMDLRNILFVRAKLKDDYVFDGIKQNGFDIVIPYKDKNIFLRLLREVWFRLKLPKREIWFNKYVERSQANTIIVCDPLITPDYLEWIIKKHPNARVILDYENRADTTINPDSVNRKIEKWSYDKYDCKKYRMKLIHPSYFDCYKFESSKYEKEYDVLYLGRDKGRLERIEELERSFNKKGLRTYFHICADRAYMRFKNKKYKKVIPYKDYLSLMKQSKAILNIARTDQDCVTQRELEAAFDGVKCISNNSSLKSFELYDPSRYFILGDDDIENVRNFINEPFAPIDEGVLEEYRFQNVIQKTLIEGEKRNGDGDFN